MQSKYVKIWNTKNKELKIKTFTININQFNLISEKYSDLLNRDNDLETSNKNPNIILQIIENNIKRIERAMSSPTKEWYVGSKDPIYSLTPSLKKITKGYESSYKEYGEELSTLKNDFKIVQKQTKSWIPYKNITIYEKEIKKEYGEVLSVHIHQLTDWPTFVSRTISEATSNKISSNKFKIILDEEGKKEILRYDSGKKDLENFLSSPFVSRSNNFQNKKNKHHKEYNMETPSQNQEQNQYFNIFLSGKNIKKDKDKQYLVSIPKIGLTYLPKSTISFFEVTNKNTREILPRIKLSFAFEYDYTFFQKKQGISQEIPLKGEELFEKFKTMELSKELNVGLKLSPKNSQTNDSKLNLKKSSSLGMGI